MFDLFLIEPKQVYEFLLSMTKKGLVGGRLFMVQ